jgi:hypothetical protein
MCGAYPASNLGIRADEEMDQQTIIAHLALKELSARAIHEDLRATLSWDSAAYS